MRLPGAFLTRGGAVDDLFAPRALAVFAGRGTEGALLRHNVRVLHRVQDPENNSLRFSRAATVGHELHTKKDKSHIKRAGFQAFAT